MSIARALPPLREVAAALPGDLRRAGRQVAGDLLTGLVAVPPRPLLALLRRVGLEPRVRTLTLRTRSAAVEEGLTCPARFRVTPYAAPMQHLAPGVALALDGAEHTAARGRLDAAVAVVDPAEVGRWADARAGYLLDLARPDGAVDLVTEYAEPLLTGFVEDFLGVPAPPRDPLRPEDHLAAWAGAVFEQCFLNLSGDPGVIARAEAAIVPLRAAVAVAVEQAGAAVPGGADGSGGGPPSTVLARMVHLGQHREQVVNDVVGLVVGAVPTTTEALGRVVEHLWRHPDAARAAVRAAHAGHREGLRGHVRECLRFNPQSPGLLRAPADGPPGAVVMLSTLAAMHDPRRVPGPGRYRPGRPEHAYLHFGAGPHRCPGEPFAEELLVSALGVLLRAVPVRDDVPTRPDGATVRLVSDGPLPRSMPLVLDPRGPHR